MSRLTPFFTQVWINAQSYGFSPANTAAGNAAALNAAIAACPDMGRLFVPRGRYLVANLAPLRKTVALVGEGKASFPTQRVPFGDPSYADPAQVIGGTVLLLTDTAGTFLDGVTAMRYGGVINLEHIALVGVGDNTVAVQAVTLGPAGANPAFAANWNAVSIANVALGQRGKLMLECVWRDVTFRSCQQAFIWSDGCNANQVDTLLVQHCGASATKIVNLTQGAANGVHNNAFTNVVLQTNYAGTALGLDLGAQDNTFISLYCENPNTFGLGIDYALDLASGADTNTFRTVHTGYANDKIRVAGNDNQFRLTKYINGAITDTSTSGNTWETNSLPTPGLTTNYPALVRMPRAPKVLTSANSPYSPTIADDVLWCDTTSGNITVNLPAAATQKGKRLSWVKVATANTLTVNAAASETIDQTVAISDTAQNAGRVITCDGTRWRTEAKTS